MLITFISLLSLLSLYVKVFKSFLLNKALLKAFLFLIVKIKTLTNTVIKGLCWVFTTLTRPVWLEQCG